MNKHDMVSVSATKEEMAALLERVRMSFGDEPSTNTEWMLLKLCERHSDLAWEMSIYQRDVLALAVVQRFDAVIRCRDGR